MEVGIGMMKLGMGWGRVVQALAATMLLAGCVGASTPGGRLMAASASAALPARAQREQEQEQEREQQIVAACTDLVLDYALLRDQGDVDGYTGLFSETGSLTLRGQTITGVDAIRQRMREARNGPRTRHLMSTIRIKPVDESRATGISYATVYLAPEPADSGPAYVDGFAAIGNYVDEFVRTPEGWRIQSRVFEEAFLPKAE